MQPNTSIDLKTMRHAASLIAALLVTALLTFPITATAQRKLTKEQKIMDALRAAPSSIALNATVKDRDGTVLREGSNGWVCQPTEEAKVMAGKPREPRCDDAVWQKLIEAGRNNEPFKTDRIGFSYMLMGDNGTSNIDPRAKHPTPDNEWVAGGPHLMILVPDEKMLEGLPTDPETGGPYIMYKGTRPVHIMVPTQ